MAMGTSSRGGEKNVQDWINLVCGVLLFISPWALGFSGDLMAARTAWVGGIVIFVMGVAALVQFAEWEEWVALIVGVLVIIRPGSWDFAAIHAGALDHASCSGSSSRCLRSRRSGSSIIPQRSRAR